MKVWSYESEKKFENGFELLTIGFSFAGLLIEDYEVARYFLALRVLRLRIFLCEISQLETELTNLVRWLKMGGSILVPILFMTFIYAIAGLHFFGGNHELY